MNDQSRLIEVINEISTILEGHDQASFAAKLQEQVQVLISSSSSEEVSEVHGRLHRSVHGMGGLLDLWLPAPSHEESVRAREELDSLCDELYELTK